MNFKIRYKLILVYAFEELFVPVQHFGVLSDHSQICHTALLIP